MIKSNKQSCNKQKTSHMTTYDVTPLNLSVHKIKAFVPSLDPLGLGEKQHDVRQIGNITCHFNTLKYLKGGVGDLLEQL